MAAEDLGTGDEVQGVDLFVEEGERRLLAVDALAVGDVHAGRELLRVLGAGLAPAVDVGRGDAAVRVAEDDALDAVGPAEGEPQRRPAAHRLRDERRLLDAGVVEQGRRSSANFAPSAGFDDQPKPRWSKTRQA